MAMASTAATALLSTLLKLPEHQYSQFEFLIAKADDDAKVNGYSKEGRQQRHIDPKFQRASARHGKNSIFIQGQRNLQFTTDKLPNLFTVSWRQISPGE
jgi:hypothetical protein